MPRKRKKVLYEWFVKPLNPQTNEAIALRLNELQTADESKIEIVVKVAENHFEKESVWRVPRAFITEITKAKTAFPFLKFSVYNCQAGQAYVRLWGFTGKKKSAKVEKASSDLEALKNKKGVV